MTAVEVASTARSRVDRIKTGVEVVWHLIVESYQARDWEALGYATWDEMCTREFGTSRLRLPREERSETVQSLRDAGLSLRAIEAATGVSVTTVRRELSAVPNGTPEPTGFEPSGVVYDMSDPDEAEAFFTDLTVNRETGEVTEDEPLTQAECEALDTGCSLPTPKITGLDGKQYSPAAPRAPQRKPLGDEFRGAALDLDRVVGRVTKLAADDRFKKNADQISQSYLHDLIRARDALQCVINQLGH